MTPFNRPDCELVGKYVQFFSEAQELRWKLFGHDGKDGRPTDDPDKGEIDRHIELGTPFPWPGGESRHCLRSNSS